VADDGGSDADRRKRTNVSDDMTPGLNQYGID